MKRLVCAIIFLLLGCLPLKAARIHSAAGSTSATFLKIGVGPRALGMASTFAGVADDVYALYWNPAGLTRLNIPEASFMHNEYFQGLNQEFLGYAQPLSRQRAIGVSLNGIYTPKDLERRSGVNENIPEAPLTEAEGKFRAYDMAATVGFAAAISDTLSWGSALKLIRQTIDTEAANGIAIDGGLLWQSPIPRLSIGAAIQNIGPGIKFNAKRFNLPLNVKAGAGYTLFKDSLLLALDLNQPIDNYLFTSMGVEYRWRKTFFLRTGYRYRWYGNELDSLSGLAVGAGFSFYTFTIDYSYNPFGDLGDTHRFSLTVRLPTHVTPRSDPVIMPTAPQPAAEKKTSPHLRDGLPAYDMAVQAKPLLLTQQGIKCTITAEGPAECPLKRLYIAANTRTVQNITMLVHELSPAPQAFVVYKQFKITCNTPLAYMSERVKIKIPKQWFIDNRVSQKKTVALVIFRDAIINMPLELTEETSTDVICSGNTLGIDQLIVGATP